MSEGDAQVAASPSIPRLAELGRAITRGIKTVVETTSGPSFAASLASASQSVQGDAPGDGTVAHGGHRAGEAPLAGAEFGPRGRRDHAAGASPTGAFEPASAGVTASLPPSTRPPAVTAIRPEGRSLGPVPAASSASTPTTAVAPTAGPVPVAAPVAPSAPVPSSAPSAASAVAPAASAPAVSAAASTTAQTTAAPTTAPSSATQPQTTAPAAQPTQPYLAAASSSASQPVNSAATSPAAPSLTYANVGPPGPSTSVPAAQTTAPVTAPATAGRTYATGASVADGQTTASGAANSPAYAPASPTTVAPYGSAPATAQAAQQASPAASTVASAAPRTTATAPSGFTADARSAAADTAPTYAATAATASTAGTTSAATTATTATGASPAATTVATTGTSTSQPLALNQYPVPNRSDRSGVLSWASDSPPTGREIDRLIAEARHRKAGWVTFAVNPDHPDEYGKLADRLTKAGIQPIARVEDPYGDLPAEDVSAIVKELRGHGVRYFQLFDGANVASETPDDRVDVRDYAERWLTAAKAVVAGGGLPGVGALAPDGDYDDLGFLRQVLSAVKERGGADVLGQSWLALRGETAGATATSDDTASLADRASWFDRVSRQALGRSLPILATQDPSGQPERLPADPATATPTSQVEQSEQTLRRHRRSLPALFAASRGTLGPART